MRKRCATKAAERCKIDSWWRLLYKPQRLKRLDVDKANAGEAQQSAKTPKEKPLRRAKRCS